MRYDSTVTIEAPADVVWRLTVDVTNLPALTPTMTRVVRLDEGPMHVGSQARIKQPRQPEAVWTVTRLEEGHEFVWRTQRMGLTMTASHHVERLGDRSRNTLALDVDGRGASLFGWFLGRNIRKALETENAGFQTRAEELSGRKSST
jgi:uncharacterized membrane protein